MCKCLFLTFFSICYLAVATSGVQALQTTNSTAQETSETATTSATTQELKKRIEKIVEEKREQVKGVIDRLTSEKRARIGEVQRITDETITISHTAGTSIIPLSERVKLIKDDKPVAVSDVSVGNWVVVMGSQERTQIDPEYVIISTESLRPRSHIVLIGSITEISRTSLTLQPRSEGESPKTMTLVKNTTYQAANGTVAQFSEFSEDITVLVTGFITETGIEASTVRSLAPVR
jgi:hypothetical protein